MLSLIGLIGGFFFAYAAVPQTIKTIKAGKHLGTPVSIATAIILGTIFMYVYLYQTYGFNWVITINYIVELVSWVILWCYGMCDRYVEFDNDLG